MFRGRGLVSGFISDGEIVALFHCMILGVRFVV